MYDYQTQLWRRLLHVEDGEGGELHLREEICRIGRRMDESGLAMFLGVYAPGNLSARLPGSERIIVTPSGFPKGSLKPEDLVVVDLHGNRIEGKWRPSIETPMHCAIYRRRQDVNGIVHAHAPRSLAYAVAYEEIPATTIELAGVTGGRVPVAKYVTPATEELGEVTAETLGEGDAVLMGNHGLVAVGRSLEEAFNNALSVEYTAMVNIYAKVLGRPVELPTEEVRAVRRYIIEKYGQK
jgi:L-fuculose-phosphate aldolase